jgi:anti-sigma regulatory factor (Ser/Thr protein kinase)
MCNQVRGFHRGVRKFIAKIQTTFPNCADINVNACFEMADNIYIHSHSLTRGNCAKHGAN